MLKKILGIAPKLESDGSYNPSKLALKLATVSKTKTYKDARNFVINMIKRTNDKVYLIIDNSNQKIVGFLDLKNINWDIPNQK